MSGIISNTACLARGLCADMAVALGHSRDVETMMMMNNILEMRLFVLLSQVKAEYCEIGNLNPHTLY